MGRQGISALTECEHLKMNWPGARGRLEYNFFMNTLLNKSNYILNIYKISCIFKKHCSSSQDGAWFWYLPGEGHAKISTLKRRATWVIHKLVIGSLVMMIGYVGNIGIQATLSDHRLHTGCRIAIACMACKVTADRFEGDS